MNGRPRVRAACAVFLLAALLLAPPVARALPMYKCVDAKGVTHYSEKPLPGCRGKEIDIQPLPPPSGAERPPGRDLGDAERDFQRRRADRAATEKKDEAEQRSRERRCQSLRSDLARYQNSRRVVTGVDAKGERTYMPDDERDRRIAALQAEVASTCR